MTCTQSCKFWKTLTQGCRFVQTHHSMKTMPHYTRAKTYQDIGWSRKSWTSIVLGHKIKTKRKTQACKQHAHDQLTSLSKSRTWIWINCWTREGCIPMGRVMDWLMDDKREVGCTTSTNGRIFTWIWLAKYGWVLGLGTSQCKLR